jgi:RNA ligase (TIGR02306 family)
MSLENEADERKSSTHKVEVVPVVLTPHTGADTLSIVHVFGYTCCVRTADWQGVTKAAYIVADSLVDVRRPEFSFLAEKANEDGYARIKAMKLRGVYSFGLLVPLPDDAVLGEDLAEKLGVLRYEPPVGKGAKARDKFVIGGEEEPGPKFDNGPNKYDVEAFERYAQVTLKEGEPVFITEKLDGSNCRVTYWNDRFWVKTRNRWVKRVPSYSHVTVDSLVARGVSETQALEIVEKFALRRPEVNGFWKVLEANPVLQEYLKKNPGTVVFGEIYGNINRIKYGLPEVNAFAIFDIYRENNFLDSEDLMREITENGLTSVPVYKENVYSFDLIKTLSNGWTRVPNAAKGVISEGVVVRPVKERVSDHCGRVILKCVNPEFLLK